MLDLFSVDFLKKLNMVMSNYLTSDQIQVDTISLIYVVGSLAVPLYFEVFINLGRIFLRATSSVMQDYS